MVGPYKNTCTSATGFTVVVTRAEGREPLLLFVFGSDIGEVAEAISNNELTEAEASSEILKVAAAPGASVGRFQVTTPVTLVE